MNKTWPNNLNTLEALEFKIMTSLTKPITQTLPLLIKLVAFSRIQCDSSNFKINTAVSKPKTRMDELIHLKYTHTTQTKSRYSCSFHYNIWRRTLLVST